MRAIRWLVGFVLLFCGPSLANFAIFQTASNINSWQPILIGTGGILTGIDIAPDGTRVGRTDSFGGYIWNASLGKWQQLATGTRMPAGTLDVGQGFEEIKIDYGNSSNIWATWNGLLYKSTNKAATFSELTNFPTQPAPYANQNSPTKGYGPYIAIDPNDGLVAYVSTPSQGLERTLDGGVTWAAVTAVSAALPANQGSGTTPTSGTDSTSLAIGTGTKVFSNNSASFGFSVSTTNFVKVWETSNPANQMFGTVTASGGTSFTLSVQNVQGSGTHSDWTVGQVNSTGGGHRISFDNSGLHNCGAGSNQTCNIFEHTYHVGTWKSTDGGATWNPVTATNAPTSIYRWAVDPFGVLWVVTDDFAGNTNLAKYDGTTWTNPITAAGCCGILNFTSVAIDTINSPSKGATHVLFMADNQLSSSFSTDGGATWTIGGGTSNRSFSSPAGDVAWLNAWYNAQSTTAFFGNGDVAFDPLNSGVALLAAEGVWSLTPASGGGTSASVAVTQQSKGIEEFIAAHVYAPTGGSVFLQNWDYPCFATSVFTAYPSVATCNMNSSAGLTIGFSYDWLWSNPAEAAAINQDSSGSANAVGKDVSGSTMTAGGNGTWTNFATRACTTVPPGGEIAIAAHLTYVVVCTNTSGNQPKFTTDGGTTWNPIVIPGGTPTTGWGLFNYFVPNSRTLAVDHTNGDIYIYNVNTGSGSDQVYKRTQSTGLWSAQGSPGFPSAFINEQFKTVFGQTGHMFFTAGLQSGTQPTATSFYFSLNSGVTWNTVPGFQEVLTFDTGAPFGSNYSSVYVLGWYSGTVNLETGGTQVVSNQYWMYMCKNFATSTRLCTGNWTQIGPTPYPGDVLVSTNDIAGDPVTPGLVYAYGQGGAWWGQFNFLLKRDIDPASNDNSPMWLEKAA